ncbi:hypothetical protein HJG60_011193 [Phyllostomus discolor]|uniref:Uncharacterized protein n=1 Tax=Phyllostomus discolor TaxID=89673 RepID=A0A834A217_9CHIR|nr:hypothetical protein HJG60_011193 [Phyllostomus discolor]
MGFLETPKPIRSKLSPARDERGPYSLCCPQCWQRAALSQTNHERAYCWHQPSRQPLSPTSAHCPCTLTSFPRADAGHPGGHPPMEKLPRVCILGWRLPRSDSDQAGHPFVLCPRDKEGSTSGPGVMGSRAYRGCSWKAGLMQPGQPDPKWTSTSLVGQQSCASSHDSCGQGWGAGSP